MASRKRKRRIETLQPWQIAGALKAVRVTQREIAKACDCSQALVSDVIFGLRRGSPAGLRVMAALEEAIGHGPW